MHTKRSILWDQYGGWSYKYVLSLIDRSTGVIQVRTKQRHSSITRFKLSYYIYLVTFYMYLQKTPECRRLSVKQHLLEVAHRVTKYQAALKGW